MPAPRPVRLARLLRTAGTRFIVVGGTARYLAGDPREPLDLDMIVRPDDVGSLVEALGSLGTSLDHDRTLVRRDVRVLTSYGPLDVFVGP